MTVRVPLMYKIATEPSEFEQIHALNYRTFVEEIPQHASNGHRRLIDRLHDENTYIICLAGQALAGMVALRGRRPFSLDEKLADLDRHIPPDRNPCEIRLLAVDPKFRKTIVFAGLVLRLAEVAKARGHDLALISGTTRQLKLYMHLGFVPFGPLVGSENAPYQPMMLTLDRFESRVRALLDEHSGEAQETVSFLPGPVQISPAIQRAFARPAISHREKAFADMVVRVKGCLRELTGAANVSLLLGSGTLANDVIAAQLHASAGTGLILSNGEFGERLIDHGRRSQLEFAVHRLPWGEPFDLAQLGRTMVMHRPKWIWFAHCETSTSMLNDLPGISRLCARLGIELCVDAISSLGTLPVDLGGVAFASGVSGKGFGAHSGIAIVFHRAPARPNGMPLPRYLDLSLYAAEDAVPFTQSSNLLASLDAALAELGDQRFELIRRKGQLLRQRLEESGFRCVVPAHRCAPAVVTLAAPAHISSAEVAAGVARFGYKIAFGSAYLVERNWLQIAVMGDCTVQQITDLVALLRESVQARLVA